MKLLGRAAFVCWLAGGLALAQFSSTIQGVVTDSSGAVVPRVKVRVTNVATGVARESATNGEGLYRVLNLGPGEYRVTAETPGFRPVTQEGVQLASNETVRVDLALQVGEVTENVSVTGQVARLETEQGRVSGTIERRQLTDLPINGRNLYGLIALQPGVTGKGLRFGGGLDSNAPIAGGTTVLANANGQRTDSNNFTVDDASVNSPADGGSARLTPNAESVDEVRVVTNNFSAVEGRNSGAQVQVITKSGTNQLHGAVLEDFTNNTLSTRNVFEGASVPVFRRNEFGYNIGGPIVKNRTFFFHSFEGLRGSGGRGTVATVETAAFRDFILRTRPNSIAAKLLGNSRPLLYPDQNLRDLGSPAPGVNVSGPNDGILDIGNVQYVPDTRRNGEQYSARIDHELRPGKDRLYGNFYYTPSVSLSGGVRPDFDRPTINKTYYIGP